MNMDAMTALTVILVIVGLLLTAKGDSKLKRIKRTGNLAFDTNLIASKVLGWFLWGGLLWALFMLLSGQMDANGFK